MVLCHVSAPATGESGRRRGVVAITIKRLLAYLKPHARHLAVVFALLLVATFADLSGPYIIKIYIDRYLTPHKLILKPLLTLATAYILLNVISVCFNYLQGLNSQIIALRIIRELRIALFAKVQKLGVSYFDKNATGVVVSRVTNDTEAVRSLYSSVLSTFMQNSVYLLAIFVPMFMMDVRLAFVCLFLLPAIFALMYVYRKVSAKVYSFMRKQLGLINAKLNESLQGMGIIQAMCQERRQAQEFSLINGEYYRAALKNIKLGALLQRPAVDLIYLLALITVLGLFGLRPASAPVKIGVLFAFISYLQRFFDPVNMIMTRLSEFQQAIAAAERVFELFDEDELAPAGQDTGNSKITAGLICFDQVSFSYDGVARVLKDITFRAEPGQTVALVGYTGSGKSTVINLLTRFYGIRQGAVTIDGTPLECLAEEELRQKIGLVLQEPFLFTGDIKQNIRLGNAGISDDDIKAAAQFVQADHFINKLKDKYREQVTGGGATFSVGQRQLLSFARAMAINPKILILDEATASIDTETEELIQEALRKMRKGRTCLVVAHRLSTIQDADVILVMHRGKIVERGNHQELLAQKGLYYRMYLLQQGGEQAVG